jgi:DNA helicase-2/ATP-dependent DNA helicase PcrA
MGTPVAGPPVVKLNAQQRAAVEHLHGPLLVVAGAGSGKTRVITERVAYLLEAIPELSGESILAVTFTEKAAAEMAERIRRRTDKRGEAVRVQTFHAFCRWLLCEHDQKLRVLDDIDAWIFLRRRLPELGLDRFRHLAEPGRFLHDFLRLFSRCQDELVSPEEYAAFAAKLTADFEAEKLLLAEDERTERAEEAAGQQELARVYAATERLLRAENRVTFGGLLFRAVELLRSSPALLERYQERFRYLLVDEFQDANVAQIQLLWLLAGRHRNLMAVGDDDQAIYRFRGASYASFRLFAELFPDRREILLTQNYRSTRRILQAATQLIEQNGAARYLREKELKAVEPAGEKVRLVETESPEHEAAYVVGEILRLCDPAGTVQQSYHQCAVLYRAHLHRGALVDALTHAGIPFVIRKLNLLDHTLLRDLVAYLRAIGQPDDNISFARLLAVPAWRFPPDYLFELAAGAQREKISLAEAAEALHESVRKRNTNLEGLLSLLRDLRLQSREQPLTELFEELCARLELRLLASDPDRSVLEQFAEFLKTWEAEKSETRRLREFLEYLDYFEDAGGRLELSESRAPADAVELMTVHAAKGLEFENVFLLRLNRHEFPVRKRRPLFVFPEALMKEALPPGDFHIQEERRLCYVAMTRARRRLTLLTVADERRPPSVFLEDILRDARVRSAVEETTPAANLAAADPPAAVPLSQRAAAQSASRIATWARAALAPPIPDPLLLSHSAIETYNICPLKYLFAERWQIPTPATPAMMFGVILHQTVREYFRARQRRPDLPLEELLHLYEQEWRAANWPFGDAYQRQAYFDAGQEQLRGFFERHRAAQLVVLEQEKNFRWALDGLELTGRIDQINSLEERRAEIIEYKTGRARTKRDVERSLQLALYAAAAAGVLELRPARLTLYNLTTNEPVSVEADEKRQREALERVREIAARIRNGEFPAQPGFPCTACEYRPLCPAHEQPAPPWLVSPEKN